MPWSPFEGCRQSRVGTWVRDVAVYVSSRRSSGCNASPILHENWVRRDFGVRLATPAGTCANLQTGTRATWGATSVVNRAA